MNVWTYADCEVQTVAYDPVHKLMIYLDVGTYYVHTTHDDILVRVDPKEEEEEEEKDVYNHAAHTYTYTHKQTYRCATGTSASPEESFSGRCRRGAGRRHRPSATDPPTAHVLPPHPLP